MGDLQARLRRCEAELAKQKGDVDLAAEFAPWRDWWTARIGEYPPEFPPEMPARVKQHFLTLVLMDLSTCPVPLSEVPPHIVAILPADLIDHLKTQFPSDEELAAKSDFEWEEARRQYTAPHYADLSARRQALRALDNQKGTPNDEP